MKWWGLLVGVGATVLVIVACTGGGDTSTVDGGSSGVVADASGGSSGASGTPVTDGSGGATCSLPSESGNCEGAFPRFFFNSKTGKCESFTYGGCGGNANNFASPKECVAACAPGQTNACEVTTCPNNTTCLFKNGTSPECATPCDEAGTCAVSTQSCTCGSSCPGCKDCSKACFPN